MTALGDRPTGIVPGGPDADDDLSTEPTWDEVALGLADGDDPMIDGLDLAAGHDDDPDADADPAAHEADGGPGLVERLTGPVSRRRFLGASAGALTVTFTAVVGARARGPLTGLAPQQRRVTRAAVDATPAATGAGAVTGWVTVNANGTVTIRFPGGEMGQGSLTGLSQAVAEELKVDWGKVRWVAAPAKNAYFTAGSSAIRSMLQPMRIAGAQAREMLIAAAAAMWGIPASRCTATGGTVVDTKTSRVLKYSQLATLAAKQPVPASPPLTPESDWRIMGRAARRLDLPSKTNGTAQYGIDVRLPNMVYAAIKHAPAIGGKLRGKPPIPRGCMAVVALDDACAVVASNTWLAFEGVKELEASWTTPAGAADDSSDVILATAKDLLQNASGVEAEAKGGDAGAAIDGAAQTVAATYELPYLAHAPMEVLNCTVRLTATKCEIWVPTQAPTWVIATAKALTGLPDSKIKVHTTLMGGGLGRKFEQDYVAQAILVAKAIGKPVKLTWPREEDFSHDQYRPMSVNRLRAGLDADNHVVGWVNRIVQPSILGQRGWIGPGQNDSQCTEGATDLPYDLGALRVEWIEHPAKVPVGFWRSVGHSINAFAVESFIDELADAAGVNPYQFRRRLLQGKDRFLAVLDAAADLGDWGTPVPAGRARGIAIAESFGSIVAEVAEVSQPSAGAMKVHRVAVAIDCGRAINPGQVRAQAEGGVVHGLSAALWGRMEFTNRRASVRNFNAYRLVRMREMPDVKVTIIESGMDHLGGIGEVAVPPIAPAVANAWFALTGERVRTLPFFPGQSRMGDG